MRASLMNGAGNRFILVDIRGQDAPRAPTSEQLRAWAELHPYDQFLLLEDAPDADAFMRIWNCDGEEVGACGNGTRAAAWAMMRREPAAEVCIDTQGGVLRARPASQFVISVDMGKPRLGWAEIPLARQGDTVELGFAAIAGGVQVERPGLVNMGNPHAVFFVRDTESIPLAELGPEIEHDPIFPEKVNASFAQIIDGEHIRLRVWERGAGITAACGTAACATLVAAHRRGLIGRSATIHADGGDLHIEWRQDDHVILTGPVEDDGEIDIDF